MRIITYHYVKPDLVKYPHSHPILLDCFRKQLDSFTKEPGLLTQEQLFYSLEEKIIQKPGVVLTFDDGFSDHFHYAFPELVKRGLWGIFFVNTGPYKKKKLLGVHRTHALLGKFDSKEIFDNLMLHITESMLDSSKIYEFDSYIYSDQENNEFEYKCKRILNYFLNTTYRDIILDKLMPLYFNEEKLFQEYYLQADYIQTMQEQGMLFGSHTETHPVLSQLDVDSQEKEIAGSLDYLEQELGVNPPRMFAIPYGGPGAYNEETSNILKKLNLKCAFDFDLTDMRDVTEQDLKERPLSLPRWDCNRFYNTLCPDGV
jgi:peptidoglycan/xylan/chitin deacetylase (PgdA/CDA1 family)